MDGGALTDRDLVRLYWPVELRPAFDALFAIEDSLLSVAASSTQPALGAVRMAWWRDSLERLDSSPPPPEPRLQACAVELLPRGIRGRRLADMADGYLSLFDETPDIARVAASGAVLFDCAATLLGAEDPALDEAGGDYALGRVHRIGLLAERPIPRKASSLRFPASLRPVTGLARLSRRDLRRCGDIEPEATPARALALLAHRLTGRIA